MTNILVLNSGSSSVKFQWLLMPSEKVFLRGMVEGIGKEKAFLHLTHNGQTVKEELSVQNPTEAVQAIFNLFQKQGIDVNNISIVAHRVVHGAEKYKHAVLMTEKVMEDIQLLSDIAPLHNPANLAGIQTCQKLLPGIPNVAVFDTAFHQTLPPKAYLYGLPYELYEKFGIRKYGFHGISHKYVSLEAMKVLKENIRDFKILSCHLGSGASICAIEDGKSVEISMGFTPLEGLMMGTRAGSFDPEIVLYLLKKGYSVEEIEDMMQKKGGLKGISQKSFDVRDLREDELLGSKKSELAFQMFVYRVQRFIGSYTAALNGLDVLIFTGGVGEKAYYLRRRICENFTYLNLKLDARKNKANELIVSAPESAVTVMVVPTNEELQMARETYELRHKI